MADILNEKLLQDVLSLPSDLRAVLIEKLIASLNLPTQKEINDLWVIESERRVEEIRSGKEKPVPREKVFKEIRSRLKK